MRTGAIAARTFLLLIIMVNSRILPAYPLPLFEVRDAGAASTGLGRCSVLLPGPGFLGRSNPAQAAGAGKLTLSGASTQPYSVPGLLSIVFWGSLEWESVGIGGGFSRFGNDLYREEEVSCSIGRKTGFFLLGGSLSLNSVAIENLGRKSFGSLSFGFCYGERDRGPIVLGAVLRDIVRFGDSIKEEVRPVTALSASLRIPSTMTIILFEMKESSRYPPEFCLGVETELWRGGSVRVGMGKDPSLCSVGLGIRISFFQIDLGVEEHSDLGQTRSISISFTPSLN